MTDISALLKHHELVLHSLLNAAEIPAPRIKEAMNYALFPGGKRLRPMLVYLCGALLNTPLPRLDLIAAAIELTHCYSLVHDDLPAMDNDDLRRGKPSCHRQFDEATAILVGDGMQALAIEILLTQLPNSLPLPQVIKVIQALVNACGPAGMVSGQSMDLSELANPKISEEKLREIHWLKTGRLILSCIDMTLAASAPTPEEIAALRTFAQHLGIAFQMQDDFLDSYCKTNLLGKNRLSDASNQKTTYANLYPKEQLMAFIKQQFSLTQQALAIFGERADDLIHLVETLHDRNLSTV